MDEIIIDGRAEPHDPDQTESPHYGGRYMPNSAKWENPDGKLIHDVWIYGENTKVGKNVSFDPCSALDEDAWIGNGAHVWTEPDGTYPSLVTAYYDWNKGENGEPVLYIGCVCKTLDEWEEFATTKSISAQARRDRKVMLPYADQLRALVNDNIDLLKGEDPR